MAQAVEQKCLLEKRNEELKARVEVWVGAETDAIVLEREEFLELDRLHKELTWAHRVAQSGRETAEEKLRQTLEWNGMLCGEVECLYNRRLDAMKQSRESDHAVAELQSVVMQLMRQLGTLDAERGFLLEDRHRQWHHLFRDGGEFLRKPTHGPKASESPTRRTESKTSKTSTESAAGSPRAEQGQTSTATSPTAADKGEAVAGKAAQKAPAAVEAAVLRDLLIEVEQLREGLRSTKEAVRLAHAAAAQREEAHTTAVAEAEAVKAKLREEISEARFNTAVLKAKTLSVQQDCAAALAKAEAARSSKMEASEPASEDPLEDERVEWEKERVQLTRRLEEVTRASEMQKKSIAAAVGKLVLEKQELLDQLASRRTGQSGTG
eukprot:gnl/TRDRNA2_/TRDRNA2_67611_c0_seq1.p1 gnl/TRDRNA2_/TRDRNA2_67611_c0~~gnl/TRDRNA2_/TRDRNA2_67611_c0_seq1.p1  ORF type:complete len:400 (-),score=98.75 gnl/TRDRNA2_/TRDRNA2_67611_c0_seq1:588-1727(-)